MGAVPHFIDRSAVDPRTPTKYAENIMSASSRARSDEVGHRITNVVNALQFAKALNDPEIGGASWDFRENRLLEVGSREHPSRDKVWAVGSAPSTTGVPTVSRPVSDGPVSVGEVLAEYEAAHTRTPSGAAHRRGYGGWIGSDTPKAPKRVYHDLTEYYPAQTPAAEAGGRRREIAIFGTEHGVEQYLGRPKAKTLRRRAMQK